MASVIDTDLFNDEANKERVNNDVWMIKETFNKRIFLD